MQNTRPNQNRDRFESSRSSELLIRYPKLLHQLVKGGTTDSQFDRGGADFTSVPLQGLQDHFSLNALSRFFEGGPRKSVCNVGEFHVIGIIRLPSAMITARWIRFCSSRTLPGQLYLLAVRRVSGAKTKSFLPLEQRND